MATELQQHAGTTGAGAAGSALGAGELAILLRVHRATSRAGDREALFSALARALHGALDAERLLVWIAGRQPPLTSLYVLRTGSKLCEEVYAAEGSALAWAAQQRSALRIASAAEIRERFPHTHRQLAEQAMESALVMPLVAAEVCLGALALLAPVAGAFAPISGAFAGELAASVASVLDGCLAQERLQRQSQESAVLLEVNRAVGRHLHRDELFGALARSLQAIVPTERFGIELPIDAGERLQGHLLTPRGVEAEPTQPTILPARGTACDWVLRHRTRLVTATREELRERFPVTFEIMECEKMEALCALPLVTGERCRGVLFFMSASAGAYEQLHHGLLEQMASAVAVALDDCLAHEEVRRLRDQLAAENVYLREEIQQDHNFGEIVGNSMELRRVLSLVERVAATNATVLILGETGTGKELIARAIHERSPRRERPLVKVNCSVFSAGLVKSELFGHVKGAFTDAVADRRGRFELADGGTLFLDEVGELPLETQAKLLRVLQEREVEPVGSSQTRRVDVRVIAATNRDLERAVADGRFRQDLFFRLNVLPIRVPPLRERRADIPLLVHALAERSARALGKRIEGVSRRAMERLVAYDWPGNVRELQNIIERAVILA